MQINATIIESSMEIPQKAKESGNNFHMIQWYLCLASTQSNVSQDTIEIHLYTIVHHRTIQSSQAMETIQIL
jgi:hypothetical protein